MKDILVELAKGGSIWYFYLSGGCAVHGNDGAPRRDVSCPVIVFLEMREQGFIEAVEKHDTGFPFYANNEKSQVYKLTAKGAEVLESAKEMI